MIKEIRVWELAQEMIETHGEMASGLHFLGHDEYGENFPHFRIRIYHANGYCFELKKQVYCEPEEVQDYPYIPGLQPDGCIYHFSEPWDGFKTAGIEKAIQILDKFNDPPF